MNTEPLGRHFGSGDAVRYLLERDVTSVVRRAVIGLRVNTERRVTTIVGRAAPADVAPSARSSRAQGHATALRASHRHNQAMSHTSATVEPSQLSPAVTLFDGWQASERHSPAIPGVRASAEPVRQPRQLPAGKVGLLPLRYIAGGDVRCCNQRRSKWPLSRVFVGFNRQYVRSGHYGEVWEFFWSSRRARQRLA